jgi:hypothetical protein
MRRSQVSDIRNVAGFWYQKLLAPQYDPSARAPQLDGLETVGRAGTMKSGSVLAVVWAKEITAQQSARTGHKQASHSLLTVWLAI